MYHINITEYFEKTVRACPEKIAVIDGERSITFADLHDRVLAEAAAINRRLSGQTNQIIAVYLPKRLEAVIADLAILYSGNAYMNLDVKSPQKRTEAILAQTNPALILMDQREKPPAFNLPVHVIDAERKTADAAEKDKLYELLRQKIDTDLLCLINTSGSTGIPKTVALNHRSFIDFTEAVIADKLITDKEIVGSLSPVIFDIFSFELCMLMAAGSSLALIPESLAAFPARMLELMARTHVSFIFWVPTIMVNIANMKLLDKIQLPDLKMIWFAGEVFPTVKFNYWREKLPEATFANFYGPIEITLDCLYQVIKRPLKDSEPIPIGRPFRNTAILVLDDNNYNVESRECGKEGELCIRGSSLAMGYYNNPEKTAAAFVQNPLNNAYPEIIYRTGDIVAWNPHGELVFKGRKDTLIKHSGYRIELGEIEHAALNSPVAITNACALYDFNAKTIILIYEAQSPLPDKELHAALALALPRYMLPRQFVHVKEMPRNANGKIDRQAIKASCI